VHTDTPGFLARIYASDVAEPSGAGQDTFADWGRPLAQVTVTSSKRVYLTTGGHSYRYYLIWIYRLPPSGEHAAITTVRLFR
jgi:hypothetical protein